MNDGFWCRSMVLIGPIRLKIRNSLHSLLSSSAVMHPNNYKEHGDVLHFLLTFFDN